MRLAYRPEQAEDAAFLRALLLETFTEHLVAWSWPEPLRTSVLDMQIQAQLQEYRRRSDTSILVLDGHTPVGWYMTATSADAMHLIHLVVQAPHRGQGIGSAVLGQLLDAAATAQKPLRLSVAANNPRALQLYLRLGFQPCGGDAVYHRLAYPPART